MLRRSLSIAAIGLALIALAIGGMWWWEGSQSDCCAQSEPHPATPIARTRLGLMTSLPLYWAAGADMAAITAGDAEVPWQRETLEHRFELVPLDTLSLIPGLSPDDAETDPLAGLEYLAIIQPRGLSPADNVALDDWVNGGGHLLLVLDPLLTGEYPFALGDPRRPADMALIPPVIDRWGLAVEFDEAQEPLRSARIGGSEIALVQAGRIAASQNDESCAILGDGIAAQCAIGAGKVTLVVDAALFEHRELAGANGESIQALMDFAFE